jgi:hypothetical protein
MSLVKPKRLRLSDHAKNRSKPQEEELACLFGGRVTKGSGNKNEKGDVRVSRFIRIEAKCTSNKSFSITREMIKKIEDAALGGGEVPTIIVEFLGPNGAPQTSVAIVPLWAIGEAE